MGENNKYLLCNFCIVLCNFYLLILNYIVIRAKEDYGVNSLALTLLLQILCGKGKLQLDGTLLVERLAASFHSEYIDLKFSMLVLMCCCCKILLAVIFINIAVFHYYMLMCICILNKKSTVCMLA